MLLKGQYFPALLFGDMNLPPLFLVQILRLMEGGNNLMQGGANNAGIIFFQSVR